MVKAYIQYDGKRGMKFKERIAVFACFENDSVVAAEFICGADKRKHRADDIGGIAVLLAYARQNTGAGGLAVCSGDAYGMTISCGNCTEQGSA